MLSDSCPVRVSCLSVGDIRALWPNCWTDQYATLIGKQLGLGPDHIVLDRDPAPVPWRDTAPQFKAHICCGQMAAWIKMPLGMELGLASGDYVLEMNAAPSPKRRRSPPPKKKCRPMFIGAKRLDGSRWY